MQFVSGVPMRFLSIFGSAAAVLLIACGPAVAQTGGAGASTPARTSAPSAAQQALAGEVVAALGLADALEQSLELIGGPMLRAQMAQDPNFRAEWHEPLMQSIQEELAANGPLVRSLFADAYARRFSEQELRDIVAFFRTPTGRAFAARQRELMDAGEQVGEELFTRISPGIMERFARKIGAPPPGPPPGQTST